MLEHTIQSHLESFTRKMGNWKIEDGKLTEMYNEWMKVQYTSAPNQLKLMILKVRMQETAKIIKEIEDSM